MRKLFIGLATACTLVLGGSAGAGVTVDLIWQDTGTSTISLPALTSRADCSGFNNTQSADGLCARIVFTTSEGIYAGGSSLAWDTSTGLIAEFASFLPTFGVAAGAIPVGKSNFFVGFPDPSVTVDNVGGTASSFIGFSEILPADGTTGLAPGSYTVGTIVFDTSGLTTSSAVIDGFLLAGVDAFLDLNANEILGPIVLNSATVLVPEPGTALMLGLGLAGLHVGVRRRRRRVGPGRRHLRDLHGSPLQK